MNKMRHQYVAMLFAFMATISYAELKETISDGSRVTIEGKGFSITPLAGWKVIEGDANISLIIESPVKHNDYQANIQINTFDDPVYIDQFSAEHLSKWFTDRLNEKTVLSDLAAHESQKTNLSNGAPALLYFYEFTAHGKAMMQVNIVASSKDRHYILTYNDLKANYDLKANTGGYEAAWNIMASIETDTMVGKRYDVAVQGGIVLAALLILFGVFQGVRTWRRNALLKEFDQDDFPVYKDSDEEESTKEKIQAKEPNKKKAKAKEDADDAELFNDGEWNLDKDGTDD